MIRATFSSSDSYATPYFRRYLRHDAYAGCRQPLPWFRLAAVTIDTSAFHHQSFAADLSPTLSTSCHHAGDASHHFHHIVIAEASAIVLYYYAIIVADTRHIRHAIRAQTEVVYAIRLHP